MLRSDTRFLEAHRLYAACGWEMQPEIRELHDLSNTTETCSPVAFRPPGRIGFG
ncbi:MAG: hypothetical protein M3P91_04200 [Actinomycetota bacterium]|nr:hypothetical protein [Actinomycetota bacterium]